MFSENTALMQWGANVHIENLGFQIVIKVLEFLEFKHSWIFKKGHKIKILHCFVTIIKVILFNCVSHRFNIENITYGEKIVV